MSGETRNQGRLAPRHFLVWTRRLHKETTQTATRSDRWSGLTINLREGMGLRVTINLREGMMGLRVRFEYKVLRVGLSRGK